MSDDIPDRVDGIAATLHRLGVVATDATISPPELAATHASAPSTPGLPGPAEPLPPTLPLLPIGGGGAADLSFVGPLGEGGMGRFELLRQHSLGRDVAVKRVRPDRYNAAAVSALLREARFTGALEHPNIVPVHLLGRDAAGQPLLVMKRVEGVSWLHLIELSRLRHDADLRVSGRQRALLFGLILLLGLGFAFAVTRVRTREGAPNVDALVVFPLVLLAVLGIVVLLKRKVLLVNRANRRLIAAYALAMGALFLHRALGRYLGMPVQYMLAGDLVLAGMFLAVAGVTIQPLLGLFSPVPAVAALLVTQAPQRAMEIFFVAMSVCVAGIALFWERAGRAKMDAR